MVAYEELTPENGCVIAEFACGHEGDVGKFKQLVDSAIDAGATIIKSQIFIPTERVKEDHPEWQLFNDVCLGEEGWEQSVAYARQKGLTFFADIFGVAGFEISRKLDVDGYKIHSEDLLNSHFIEKVASENKILIIGVGGAHRIEVLNLLNYLKKKGLQRKIILMPGVQTFPTPIESHSIEEIGDLISKYSDNFGVKVGCADHISGDLEEAIIFPLMALAKGACVIEKHMTVDRKDKWEDYQSALGGKTFKRFIGHVKTFAPLLTKIGRQNSAEISYRHQFKKTPVVSRNLEIDHVMNVEDIQFAKYADDKIPLSSLQLVNKIIKTPIKQNTPLRTIHMQNKVGGIIVARCTSARFPNKAIKKIQDKETIALLIKRIKRCQSLDYIILATSTDKSDDILVDIAEREGVLSFRGSLDNLSLRFYEAAIHYGLDYIVRITGDDILRDEVMIDKAVQSHLHESCDVTFTRNMPYGTSSEVFSLNVLKTILNTVNIPENTEYLEYYLENDRYFSVNYVESPYQFSTDLRMTLDYEEDFQFFNSVFEHFYAIKPEFTMSDILAWIAENPAVMDINKHKTVKYTSKDIDVSLNI
tara:strand:- start:6772 stop:8535 length:1764 start_codon:yes stop_codon:yes gene_type:complete